MRHHVQDKVVVITGGSSGFGLEAAGMLLEMGAKVVITGRNTERLDSAAAQLSIPSSSLTPLGRLPEKHIPFGNPASEVAMMASRILARQLS